MKKIIIALLAMFALFALVSCSTTKSIIKEPNETITAQNANDSGKNGVSKPDWVGASYETSDKFYTSASAKFSKQSNSIKAARMQAKQFLTEYISDLNKVVAGYYANESGINGNTEVIEGFEDKLRTEAEAVLSGVMQEDMWEAEDGTIWVLMSMPLDNVEQNIQRALEEASKESNTYVENESAEKAREYLNSAMEELSNK